MKPAVPLLSPDELIERFSRIDGALRQLFVGGSRRFSLGRIESGSQLIKFPIPPHRKTFHDFFYLTHGTLVRSKGVDKYTVSAGEFFVMPAYQVTTNDFSSPDIRGFFCVFDNDVFSHTTPLADLSAQFPFLRAEARPLVIIPPAEQPLMVSLLEKIEREYQSTISDRYDLMAACLLVLFRQLNRHTTEQIESERIGESVTDRSVSAAERLTQRFKAEIAQHVRQVQRVSHYADRLAVSPNHLNKAVRQTTGRTATAWIDEMLILEAKVLLAQTSLPIADVAAGVGLSNASYFGRFFRDKTGRTPSEYRKWIDLSGFVPETAD